MADFYTEMYNTAVELITEFGLPVAISRSGTSIGPAAGVFITNKTSLDGTPQLQTALNSRTILVTAGKIDPEVGDLLTANKQTFTIKDVETHRPSTTTIFHQLELS